MFTKYSSLENHTNDKFLTKIFDYLDSNGLRNTEFVAREKIHGTNFSVIISPAGIQAAKRTGPILNTEKFFAYEDLLSRYDERLKAIHHYYFSGPPIATSALIQIFGEYAGGNIQKEVDYGDKEFYVFDILITDDTGKTTYLDDRTMEAWAGVFGFKVAPLIARCTLEDMLKLPVEFNSIVPEYNKAWTYENRAVVNGTKFEQPAPADNVAEGLVIKPNIPMYLNGGSRVAIKYKTDAFKEKGKAKAPKIIEAMSESDLELLSKFSEYVTAARVKNVISHIGELTQKMFPKVLGLTVHDIFTEAEREGLVITGADSPSRVKGELQKLVQNQVREVWVTLDFTN